MVVCVGACDRRSTSVRADGDIAPSGDGAVDTNTNLGPVANAGPDATYLVDTPFTLDGTASTDADGVIVAFQWSVDSRPAGSTASVVNDAAATAAFTPDAVGTYTYRLLVTDDDGATDDDTVTIVVPSLTVDAGPDQTVAWKSTVQLSGSHVSNATVTSVGWQFVSRPGTSTALLQSSSSLMPTFNADKVGTYIVELAVTTAAGTVADTVAVTVAPPPPDLIDGDIVDVDIGYAGQFVVASTNPNRIRVINTVYSLPPEVFEIPLSVTPSAIGVSETGEFVSIVHNSTRLTRARIPSLQQLSTIDTGTPLLDVRHGTARPHAFPAQAGSLLLIDYTEDKVHSGGLVAAAARGRMAPSASYPLYLIELGASAKLRRYEYVSQNTPFVRDWPYSAGQYPLGNDLWFVADSLIVTSAGHVFRASDDPSIDMTHHAILGGDDPFEIVGMVWGFGYVMTLHARITMPLEAPETQVRFYDYTTLTLEHVVQLPDLMVGGTLEPTRGLAITLTPFAPTHVFVVGTAGTSAAVFTVPLP